MKFELIAVGKQSDPNFRASTDDYIGRIGRYVPAEEIVVPASKNTGQKALDEEAKRLESAADDSAITIALDERGKQMSSRGLARWIDDWMVSGRRYVSFFVGSADGLAAQIRRGADRRLALSKMTFPHQMARMILAEQLYRAMTIIRGEPYHR